ncbi:hypothetical protein ACIOZM_30960, partial [Pseudomonas sp. NPDC087346]
EPRVRPGNAMAKKDHQCRFGIQAHIGVDDESCLVHRMMGTVNNAAAAYAGVKMRSVLCNAKCSRRACLRLRRISGRKYHLDHGRLSSNGEAVIPPTRDLFSIQTNILT